MTPRHLTIETYYADQHKPWHAPKSRIRLQAAWLRAAGFTPGQPVTVTLDAGTIVIQRTERRPAL